jgi:hypothetical protein
MNMEKIDTIRQRLRAIFDFVRPERWRKKRRMEDAELLAALGRMAEGDAAARSLMELVTDQFEQEMQGLLSGRIRQSRVEYQRGRAAALYALLDRVEAAREEAREARLAEMKRREQEEQGNR